MAATSTSETWDAAWSSTMRASRKELVDNISDEYPLVAAFRQANNLDVVAGGKEIQENLMYALNAFEWFDGMDTVNTDDVDGITSAFYPWRYGSSPITIPDTDAAENQTPHQQFDLLKAKTRQTMQTVLDGVNSALFGAQSGKSVLGLQDIVADAPTTGTVGGINRANEAWWRNQNNASSTNFNNLTGNIYDGPGQVVTQFNSCSEGATTPTHHFTTLTLYGELEQILQGTGYSRMEANRASGGLQLNAPAMMGRPVQYDRDCSSGHWYTLNMRFLKLKIMRTMNFAKTPFRRNTNQHGEVGFVVVGTQLTTNNARRQGVSSAFT